MTPNDMAPNELSPNELIPMRLLGTPVGDAKRLLFAGMAKHKLQKFLGGEPAFPHVVSLAVNYLHLDRSTEILVSCSELLEVLHSMRDIIVHFGPENFRYFRILLL